MISRRRFISSIFPAAAGAIIAPTLAATLMVSTKKYFFLGNHPEKLFLVNGQGFFPTWSNENEPTILYYTIGRNPRDVLAHEIPANELKELALYKNHLQGHYEKHYGKRQAAYA